MAGFPTQAGLISDDDQAGPLADYRHDLSTQRNCTPGSARLLPCRHPLCPACISLRYRQVLRSRIAFDCGFQTMSVPEFSWKQERFRRGGGTRAASRAMKSSGRIFEQVNSMAAHLDSMATRRLPLCARVVCARHGVASLAVRPWSAKFLKHRLRRRAATGQSFFGRLSRCRQ